MSKSKIIRLLRQDELRRFRDLVEDRPEIYTRYVVDTDFLVRRGLTEHPRLTGGVSHA